MGIVHLCRVLVKKVKTFLDWAGLDSTVMGNLRRWRKKIIEIAPKSSAEAIGRRKDFYFNLTLENYFEESDRKVTQEFDTVYFIGRLTFHENDSNRYPRYLWTCCGCKSKYHNPLEQHWPEIQQFQKNIAQV